MKKYILYAAFLISVKGYSQSACRGVIIGERTSTAFAQAYLESLQEKETNNAQNVLLPISDTFQIVDICVVDSVVIVELKKNRNNTGTHDTSLFIQNSLYLLSRIDTIPVHGEKLEIGKFYYLTITPYYPHGYFVSIGSPGMPIILGNTAYNIWFVGNVYYSREIQGEYFVIKNN